MRRHHKGKNGVQRQAYKRMAEQRGIFQSNGYTGWFIFDNDDGRLRITRRDDSRYPECIYTDSIRSDEYR